MLERKVICEHSGIEFENRQTVNTFLELLEALMDRYTDLGWHEHEMTLHKVISDIKKEIVEEK